MTKQRNPVLKKTRLSVVNANHPEHDNICYRPLKHVPGNSSYRSIAKVGKKVVILSDSICHGLNTKELSNSLRNKVVYKKVFPGATPKDLLHYSTRTLQNDKPDMAILNIGTNRIGKEDPFERAKDIIAIVKSCQKEGCDEVFVSAITTRGDFPDLVIQLNNILRAWEGKYDYRLIFNDNIDYLCLAKDQHHLNNIGITRLRANFRNVLEKCHA